ncbi:hypothetical protein PGB90_000771 [Kerria lacca]
MKEVKNKPNKEEREEIRQLKEEIKKLKDEMNKKESRWAAAQARIRTEMKQLKDHNTTLKEEVKELKISTKKGAMVANNKMLAILALDNVNDCTNVDNAVSHEIDKIKKLKTDEKSVKLVNNKREINMLDEQPMVPAHKDFQLLLDASLEESNCYATNKVKISNEKEPFLKKGEGLSRFRMKPEDFKLKKKNRTVKKSQPKSNKKSSKIANLDVIDEEPSKLKDTTTQKSNITMNCADNEKYNLVIVDVQDENKYLNNSER